MLSTITTENVNYDQPNHIRDYKFSFQQSYTYPHKLVSQNLGQIYFVNQKTLYDFQR